MMMYRLMRVRIYKRIFEKKDTDRPSFGEADVFPAGLTCLSAQCGARILKERKERITVLLLSADRRNGIPLHSIPSFPIRSQGPVFFIQCICLHFFVNLRRDRCITLNQTFKNSTEEHYQGERRVKVQVYAYCNVLKSLKQIFVPQIPCIRNNT